MCFLEPYLYKSLTRLGGRIEEGGQELLPILLERDGMQRSVHAAREAFVLDFERVDIA